MALRNHHVRVATSVRTMGRDMTNKHIYVVDWCVKKSSVCLGLCAMGDIVYEGSRLIQLNTTALRDSLILVNGHSTQHTENIHGGHMKICSCRINLSDDERPQKHCKGCAAIDPVMFMIADEPDLDRKSTHLAKPAHAFFYVFSNAKYNEGIAPPQEASTLECKQCTINQQQSKPMMYLGGPCTVVVIVGCRDCLVIPNRLLCESELNMLQEAHWFKHSHKSSVRPALNYFFKIYNGSYRHQTPIITCGDSPITDVVVVYSDWGL